ncbi:thiol:disulfide oxidoreductase, partial [Pseudomonas sp. ATCC 13867]
EKGKPFQSRPSVTEEGKKILFGQTAASLGKDD